MIHSTASATVSGVPPSSGKKRGAAVTLPSEAVGIGGKKKRSVRSRRRVEVDDTLEGRAHRDACRVDILEDASAPVGGENDDEYDEFGDADGGEAGATVGGKSSQRGRRGKAGVGTVQLEKAYLRPRSLAALLIEESARIDAGSVLAGYLTAEAMDESRAAVGKKGRGGRSEMDPICPVTGLLALYRDPKAGGSSVHRIGYATLGALEQLRERLPPWCSPPGGGAYHEAVLSLREEYKYTDDLSNNPADITSSI